MSKQYVATIQLLIDANNPNDAAINASQQLKTLLTQHDSTYSIIITNTDLSNTTKTFINHSTVELITTILPNNVTIHTPIDDDKVIETKHQSVAQQFLTRLENLFNSNPLFAPQKNQLLEDQLLEDQSPYNEKTNSEETN